MYSKYLIVITSISKAEHIQQYWYKLASGLPFFIFLTTFIESELSNQVSFLINYFLAYLGRLYHFHLSYLQHKYLIL